MSRTPRQFDWAAYEQDQRNEWDALQPELERFRGTAKELLAKAEENTAEFIEIKGGKWALVDRANFPLWAESLARLGRESVRFDRWRYPHITQND
ncbi:MAG TPA: hypothetical protein VIJ79_14430 [Acidobacteriaceae bacterium]